MARLAAALALGCAPASLADYVLSQTYTDAACSAAGRIQQTLAMYPGCSPISASSSMQIRCVNGSYALMDSFFASGSCAGTPDNSGPFQLDGPLGTCNAGTAGEGTWSFATCVAGAYTMPTTGFVNSYYFGAASCPATGAPGMVTAMPTGTCIAGPAGSSAKVVCTATEAQLVSYKDSAACGGASETQALPLGCSTQDGVQVVSCVASGGGDAPAPGSNAGAIAGAVIGSLAGVGLLAGVGYYVRVVRPGASGYKGGEASQLLP